METYTSFLFRTTHYAECNCSLVLCMNGNNTENTNIPQFPRAKIMKNYSEFIIILLSYD